MENIFNFWMITEQKVMSFNSILDLFLELKYSSTDALRFFQGWLNAAAVKYGGRQVSSPYTKYFLTC